MLSKTFSCMMIISFISALLTGNMGKMAGQFAVSLSDTVSLCLTLLGMMCFWSGLMNVLKDAGAVRKLSLFLKPLLRLIYGKKANTGDNLENLSASVSANFFGLGNAALPLGIAAVKGFERNNQNKTATDESIMFAVLNTVPFQLIPSTLIALRSKYGSINPYDVVPYIWVSSFIITVFAIIVCKTFSFFWRK